MFRYIEVSVFAFIPKPTDSFDSVVGTATRLHAGRPGNRGSIPDMGKRFFSSLRPKRSRDVKVTTHCHLVLRLRMSATPHLPCSPILLHGEHWHNFILYIKPTTQLQPLPRRKYRQNMPVLTIHTSPVH
jgi:hypothetical protein